MKIRFRDVFYCLYDAYKILYPTAYISKIKLLVINALSHLSEWCSSSRACFFSSREVTQQKGPNLNGVFTARAQNSPTIRSVSQNLKTSLASPNIEEEDGKEKELESDQHSAPISNIPTSPSIHQEDVEAEKLSEEKKDSWCLQMQLRQEAENILYTVEKQRLDKLGDKKYVFFQENGQWFFMFQDYSGRVNQFLIREECDEGEHEEIFNTIRKKILVKYNFMKTRGMEWYGGQYRRKHPAHEFESTSCFPIFPMIVIPLKNLIKEFEEGDFRLVRQYFATQTHDPFLKEKFLAMVHLFTPKQIERIFVKYDAYSIAKKLNLEFLKVLLPHVRLDLASGCRRPSPNKDNREGKLLRLGIQCNLPESVLNAIAHAPKLIEKTSLLLDVIEAGNYGMASLLINQGLFSPKILYSSWGVAPALKSPFEYLLQQLSQQKDLKEEEVHDVLTLVDVFLSKGEHPNQRGVESLLTIFELAFSYASNHPRIFQQIQLKLLKNGATITPRIAHSLRVHIQATGDKAYDDFLISQQIFSKEELDQFRNPKPMANDAPAILRLKLIKACNFLKRNLRKSRLNPESISLKKMDKIKALKAKIKESQRNNTFDEDFQRRYSEMCCLYDDLVTRHIFLSALRDMSHEVKQQRELLLKGREAALSRRLVTLYSLWGEDEAYTYSNSRCCVAKLYEKKTGKVIWKQMRTRMIESANTVREDPFLRCHSVVWNHGTSSASLPPILRSNKLDATGNLEKEGGVTFAGEHCGSSTSLNRTALSGESFSFSWMDGEETMLYHDASTRFLVNYCYAARKFGYYSHEKQFDPVLSWERLTVEQIKKILKKEVSEGWIVLELDIQRIRHTDPNADERLQELKKFVQEQLASGSRYTLQLKKIEDLLSETIAYHFNEEEMKLILDPYPIVFSATSVDRSVDPRMNEFFVEGPLYLSRDIPLMFAPKDKVVELQNLLGSGMRVYDFDTAFYLETMNMIKGSQNIFALINDSEVIKQQKLAASLQRDVLPFYNLPFPEAPSYYDDKGQRVMIERPMYTTGHCNYAEYKKGVEEGSMLARDIHGPLHAADVAVLTQMLLSLYKLAGRNVKSIDPFLLGIAGGTHDRCREDEGKDFWDKASSRAFKSYCQLNEDDGTLGRRNLLQYVDGIEHKDAIAEEDFDIKRIIHDADVLEIFRVLKDPGHFRKTELCFYSFEGLSIEYKDQVIEEVCKFIKMVNTFEIKAYMEENSKNYYIDLLLLIAHMQEIDQAFPHLTRLLKEPIDCFKDHSVDPHLVDRCGASCKNLF